MIVQEDFKPGNWKICTITYTSNINVSLCLDIIGKILN